MKIGDQILIAVSFGVPLGIVVKTKIEENNENTFLTVPKFYFWFIVFSVLITFFIIGLFARFVDYIRERDREKKKRKEQKAQQLIPLVEPTASVTVPTVTTARLESIVEIDEEEEHQV